MRYHVLAFAVASFMALPLASCSSTGIAVREAMGYAKREQLVERVSEARDAQEAAKKQFASALEEFIAITGVSGGELETKYKSVKREYERSESRADAVRSRIRSVENVAAALFREWESQLSQYASADLRAASERQLRDTRAQYDRLLTAMKAAESRMDPVLAAFKDQVLFLNHALNARAIAGLEGTTRQIESDVANLIRDMEKSIAEANTFVDQMQPKAN